MSLQEIQDKINEMYRRGGNTYGGAGKLYDAETEGDHNVWHQLVRERNRLRGQGTTPKHTTQRVEKHVQEVRYVDNPLLRISVSQDVKNRVNGNYVKPQPVISYKRENIPIAKHAPSNKQAPVKAASVKPVSVNDSIDFISPLEKIAGSLGRYASNARDFLTDTFNRGKDYLTDQISNIRMPNPPRVQMPQHTTTSVNKTTQSAPKEQINPLMGIKLQQPNLTPTGRLAINDSVFSDPINANKRDELVSGAENVMRSIQNGAHLSGKNGTYYVVDKNTNYAFIVKNNSIERAFPVGTGQTPANTPAGSFNIIGNLPYEEYKHIEPMTIKEYRKWFGPNILELDSPSTPEGRMAVHGTGLEQLITNSESPLARYISHGCIRNTNDNFNYLNNAYNSGEIGSVNVLPLRNAPVVERQYWN